MYLVGFRNRLSVLLQWAYAYFTYDRGVRLITDVERYKPPSLRDEAALPDAVVSRPTSGGVQ